MSFLIVFSFSAIARSVMISAENSALATERNRSSSAIARSVMISASKCEQTNRQDTRFSAIARSVMISAAFRLTLKDFGVCVSVL